MNKHVFRNSTQKPPEAVKRVATYYRVSTGRQFSTDASIPSQRKITASFCDQNGYIVAEEYHDLVRHENDLPRPKNGE